MSLTAESDDEFDVVEARDLVARANRKRKKAGGFQAMGLSPAVFKGVIMKGYKMPTPIQRKTIPILLSGRDVVAMARTGSGKTACFLIPLFEKFQCHSSSGPRALIMSPTRELAIQTLNFTKELGRFAPLTAAVILGGDKMEEQFAALHKSPDIIVATPGRFLHVIMEMNLSLKTIEYVVFDEGDRLFELGFAEQLSETLRRLPRVRQTALFSATLPKSLIEFARAGLHDPVLIRLDVDTKLSKNLEIAYISCLPDEKNAILINLLSSVIPVNQQTVVFFGTKHHVEFHHMLLTDVGLPCTCIHSGLDPIARNSALKLFRSGRVRILLVTDVAARGVDIPHLDNVINYHFPPQPKLFLHRVGRVARAGRHGLAYSLVDTDELPYLLDVLMFIGKEWRVSLPPSVDTNSNVNFETDCIGRAPRNLLSVVDTKINHVLSQNASLVSMVKVCANAMKKYIQTRPKASAESVRRAKELRETQLMLPVHSLFKNCFEEDQTNTEILTVIRKLKLPTIFEALGRNANPDAYATMIKKRLLHDKLINRYTAERAQKQNGTNALKALLERKANLTDQIGISETTLNGDIPENLQDLDFFIPYKRNDDYTEATERGLMISNSISRTAFNLEAANASLEIQGDVPAQQSGLPGSRKQLVWDRKRKRFTGAEAIHGKANLKRIKTESGVWIPASYKTDQYEQWLKRSKSDVVQAKRVAVYSDTNTADNSSSTSSYSARYGNVIEFPDFQATSSVKRNIRESSRTSRKQPKNLHEEAKLTVIGTRKWHERAVIRQREKLLSTMDKQKIRQPKGTRTYGQLRKPEQILKQRRLHEKQLQKSMKKTNIPHKQKRKKTRKL